MCKGSFQRLCGSATLWLAFFSSLYLLFLLLDDSKLYFCLLIEKGSYVVIAVLNFVA
jgi:hypothetical protein